MTRNVRTATFALAMVVAACSVVSPQPAQPSLTPAISSPARSPVPSRATPSPAPTVRLLTAGWRPRAATVVVGVVQSDQLTLVAVPLDGSSAVDLVQVRSGTSWDIRRNGTALVASVPTSRSASRIALVDLAQASVRWLTPEAGTNDVTPVFSPDGRTIFFARSTASSDAGVLAIDIDGGPARAVRGPATFGTSTVGRVTPDGVLVGARDFNGSHAWVLDLASGRDRELDACCSRIIAWRPQRPHALVDLVTDYVAPPKGKLLLWDDVDGNMTTLVDRTVGDADLDAAGQRVTFVTGASASAATVVIRDLRTAQDQVLADTSGAEAPFWLGEDVAYLRRHRPAAGFDLLLAAANRAPRLLFSASGDPRGLRLVSP